MTGYKTTYTFDMWSSPEEHVAQLNSRLADDWRVDTIFRNYEEHAGNMYNFTVYSKTEKTEDAPLVDRRVRLGDVYNILNQVIPEYDGEMRERARLISEELKKLRFE